MTEPDVRATIAAELQARGWTLVEGPNLASKMFPTAVGEKVASLWLSQPWKPDEDQMSLSGEYYSEGHNILVGCMEIVHVNAQADTVAKSVDRFNKGVESAIAESYAGRLLRPAGAIDTPRERP